MKALLIIDMQEAYFKAPALSHRKRDLLNAINNLVSEYLQNGDLIINVKTIHRSDSSTWTLNMIEDNQGFAFDGTAEVENLAGLNLADAVTLHKTRDSAFHDTELRAILQTHSVSSLLLAGVSTHSCIFQTASDAYAYNYPVRIPASAVADEDAKMHEWSLKYLAREYRQTIE